MYATFLPGFCGIHGYKLYFHKSLHDYVNEISIGINIQVTWK